MPDWPDYQLIDFGAGRKLERFGDLLLDRPAPHAEAEPAASKPTWRDAAARYTGGRMDDGRWAFSGKKPEPRDIAVPLAEDVEFRMTVDLSPAGQVGVFPEQFDNWRWLYARVKRCPTPPQVLNLFAYTGGSTLAAAAAGAEVTHVDASKPSVAIARANAERSGREHAPVRWIVEDAVRYCQREVKRGRLYHGVILDPPSYGHGPSREEWKLTRDLPKLMGLIRKLTAGAPKFLLVTCHTPGIGAAELGAYLADGVFGSCAQPAATSGLWLSTEDGRRLESGVQARWPR